MFCLLILATVAEAVLWQRLVFDDAMFRMSTKLVPLGRLTFVPSSSSFAGFRTATAGSTAMRIDNANVSTSVGALQLNLPADVRQSGQFFISCLVEPVVAQPRTVRVGMYVANVEEVQPNGDIWGQDLGAIIVTNGGWFASTQSESTGDLSTSSSRPARPNEPTLVVLSVRKLTTLLSSVRVRAFSSGENFDSFDNTSVAINTVAGQGAFTMHNHLVLVGAPIDFLECRVGSSLQDVVPPPAATTPAPSPAPAPQCSTFSTSCTQCIAPVRACRFCGIVCQQGDQCAAAVNVATGGVCPTPAPTPTPTPVPTSVPTPAPTPVPTPGLTLGPSVALTLPPTTTATTTTAATTATQPSGSDGNATTSPALPGAGEPMGGDAGELIGAAVGGSVGGLLLLGLVVALICRAKRSKSASKPTELQSSSHYANSAAVFRVQNDAPAYDQLPAAEGHYRALD